MKKILLFILLSPLFLQAQKTIIHCGKLIDVKALTVLNNMSIIVEGKKIVAVQSGYVDGTKADQIINLKNKRKNSEGQKNFRRRKIEGTSVKDI